MMGVGEGGDGDLGDHAETERGQVPPHTHTHLGEVESWEDPFLALTVLCRARTDPTAAGSALQL